MASARRRIWRAFALINSASGWEVDTREASKGMRCSAQQNRRRGLRRLVAIERPVEVIADRLFDDCGVMAARHRHVMFETVAGNEAQQRTQLRDFSHGDA